MTDLLIRWADGADQTLPLPTYKTAGAAGADLCANLPDRGEMTFAPGARGLVPLGLHIAFDPAYEVQLRMRSGLALRHGLILPNAPATIDADYRGELQLIVLNAGDAPVTINHGDRIAQMVMAPVIRPTITVKTTLPDSDRGEGGFGSTGVRP